MKDPNCTCRVHARCSNCIDREGLTKPRPLVPPIYRCSVDESAGMRDEE